MMIQVIRAKRNKSVLKYLSFFVAVTFITSSILPSVAMASQMPLPAPTQFVPLSENFSFPVLKGLKFDQANPLRMEFIIDSGSQHKVSEEEASRLIKYFLAGLTIPEDQLWVNLSPYEQNRIITQSLGQTDLGRDLLSQDYILKQLSSSLTYPESDSGKNYWTQIYSKVAEIAHTTKLPINTFNKVWIVPDKAQVYEDTNSVLITEASLKTMMEQDFFALKENYSKVQSQGASKNLKNGMMDEINKVASGVMRDLILPKISQEVNSGKNFATLRQIYHSVILGLWFKQKFQDSIYKSYINQAKIAGIDINDKDAKAKIYNLYVEAFQKGVYNYIKKDIDPATNRNIKRQYISGGSSLVGLTGIIGHDPLSKRNVAIGRMAQNGVFSADTALMSSPVTNASSPIQIANESEGLALLKERKSISAYEFDADSRAIMDKIATTSWTIKKTDNSYSYRPFAVFAQANKKTPAILSRFMGYIDGLLGGHSESREVYSLTNQDVNLVVHKGLENFKKNILALGEPATMRYPKGDPQEGKLTPEGWKFLEKQVREGLDGYSREEILRTIVAYEPIWAIGEKAIRPATKEEAQEVHAFIRKILAELIPGEENKVIIQYGGSMNPKNVEELIMQSDVDGGLIGGASLVKEQALALIKKIVVNVRAQKAEGTFNGRVPVLGFNLKAEVGGKKMDAAYLRELMDTFKFIQENLADVDFENEINIFFAVSDTEIPLFDRALKGENPVDLVDLTNAVLPNNISLAVSMDELSAFTPGAHTSDLTAEQLKLAGVKFVVYKGFIANTDSRVVRAEEAGLETVRRESVYNYNNLKELENFLRVSIADNSHQGAIVMVPAVLAREAYAMAKQITASSPVTAHDAIVDLITARDSGYMGAVNSSGTAKLVAMPKMGKFAPGHDVFKAVLDAASSPVAVSNVVAKETLDSRGNPTLEVSVKVGDSVGSAMVPSGASTGEREALELRDGDKSYMKGKGVFKAISNVNDIIADAIKDISTDTTNIVREVDNRMLALDGTEYKSKLGANALLGVSMAVLKAAAKAEKKPLYRFINDEMKRRDVNLDMTLPVPMFNILNGGAHSESAEHPDVQEFMVMPVGANSFKDALDWGMKIHAKLGEILAENGMGPKTAVDFGNEKGYQPALKNNTQGLEFVMEAIKRAGLKPGEDVVLALDVASSEFYNKEKGTYHFEGKDITAEQMVDIYAGWSKQYPIASIEDGLAEGDWAGWKILTDRIGGNVQLVGDDLFVTNPKILKKGIDEEVANSILVKLNQIGTVSETLDAIAMAHKAGYATVISHRSGETDDDTIADFSVGANTGDQIKTGGPYGWGWKEDTQDARRSAIERMTKYWRLVEIEEELGAEAVYAGKFYKERFGNNNRRTAVSSPAKLVDGAKMVAIANSNIKPLLWGTAGARWDENIANTDPTDNVSRQTAGFAEEVLDRMGKGTYKPIDGKTVRVAFAYDSRKKSDDYAYQMAKVLAAYQGFEVQILDEALPTPIVARLTQEGRDGAFDFVFHVTPSHNQMQYGGIKLLHKGSVNEHMWTYFFEKRANAMLEYPVNAGAQLKKIQVTDQLINEYFQKVFPGLIEKFAEFKRLNPNAQFTVDLMDGSMVLLSPFFERLGMKVVRNGQMKNMDYTGKTYVLADGKKVGFAPDPTQSAFYKDEPAYQEFLNNAPDGSIYFLIDGDGDRMVTIIKKSDEPNKIKSIKPNQFGPLAADYILTNHMLPEVNQIVRTYVTTAGMDAVAKYHGLPAPVIVPVGSKYFNRFVPHAIALEESGHFVAGGFFDDTIFQTGLILSMMSDTNKDVFTLLDETQKRTGYKGVDKRDDFENLSVEVRDKFIEPLTGTPDEVRAKSQKAVNEIVAQSGKELLEALVVVEGEYGVGRVVKLQEYVDSLFTDKPLVIESSNKGLIVRFTDLSWVGARLSGTGNTGRLYTEGRESSAERQKMADAVINTLGLPKASSPVLIPEDEESGVNVSQNTQRSSSPVGGIDMNGIKVAAVPSSSPVNMPMIDLKDCQGLTFRIVKLEEIKDVDLAFNVTPVASGEKKQYAMAG